MPQHPFFTPEVGPASCTKPTATLRSTVVVSQIMPSLICCRSWRSTAVSPAGAAFPCHFPIFVSQSPQAGKRATICTSRRWSTVAPADGDISNAAAVFPGAKIRWSLSRSVSMATQSSAIGVSRRCSRRSSLTVCDAASARRNVRGSGSNWKLPRKRCAHSMACIAKLANVSACRLNRFGSSQTLPGSSCNLAKGLLRQRI